MAFIQEGFRDTTIIPDKYNTGCDESKLEHAVTEEGTVCDFYWRFYSGGTVCGITFPLWNDDKIGATLTFENIDFSSHKIQASNNDTISVATKIIFNNCKFTEANISSAGTGLLTFEFNNCTFTGFSGSDSVFNKCKFGDSYLDGLRLYRYVTVNDSYISNLRHWSDSGYHSDGVQIFGSEGFDCIDIFMNNCRFECVSHPSIKDGVAATSYVNACIMLQLEYSNGNNIQFNNCMANGGNYSCYSWVKGIYQDQFTLQNALFDGCRFGYSSQSGDWYYIIKDEETTRTNCSKQNQLYVGSVWKDEDGDCHVSVTNDTLANKTLFVRTNNGIFKYQIPSTYTINGNYPQFNPQEGTTFEDFPIDIDINVGQADYVVCYDDSVHTVNQIRFVNFTENDIEEVIETTPCNSINLFNRYAGLINYKDSQSLLNYWEEWVSSTPSTTQVGKEFDGVAIDRSYRITGTIEFTVTGITPESGTKYLRLRTKNAYAFAMNELVRHQVSLDNETYTNTIEFDKTIVATKNSTKGLIEVYADGLSFTFTITNLKITDATE